MKAMIGLFPFLFYVHLLTGCKNNEIPAPTDPEPDPTDDMSITCSNKQEAGGYQPFYKPQQGFVGDPMTYFNADDNRFCLFYLYENATHHTIYLTRSADFAS